MSALGVVWDYCVSLGNVFVLLGLLALVIVFVAAMLFSRDRSSDKK